MSDFSQRVIAEIDAEIARLQHAKELLAGIEAPKKRGRPAGKSAAKVTPAPKSAKRKPLSPEARKRIAEAQRKRWAEQKRTK